MLTSFKQTGPPASNRAMQVRILPSVPIPEFSGPSLEQVPKAKEPSRHFVEVEKASASLVGTANFRNPVSKTQPP